MLSSLIIEGEFKKVSFNICRFSSPSLVLSYFTSGDFKSTVEIISSVIIFEIVLRTWV